MIELKEVRREERSRQQWIYRLMSAGKLTRYFADDGAYMYSVAELEERERKFKKHGRCQKKGENNGKQK